MINPKTEVGDSLASETSTFRTTVDPKKVGRESSVEINNIIGTTAGAAFYKRIQECIDRREFDKVESALSKHLSANVPGRTQDVDAHYLRGVNAYFAGKLNQAIHDLKKALEIDPRHTDAAICLSVLYNDIGRYDEAKKIFEVANQSVAHRRPGDEHGIDKKFAVKHLEIADLYFRYRRYDEAIEEYSKAILLDPGLHEIRIRRAKTYAKKGYITRALQELKILKEETPGFYPARIQLGLLYFSQGNLLDAELEWESVLESDPENKEAKHYLKLSRGARTTQNKGRA